jgi:hypothetical protein
MHLADYPRFYVIKYARLDLAGHQRYYRIHFIDIILYASCRRAASNADFRSPGKPHEKSACHRPSRLDGALKQENPMSYRFALAALLVAASASQEAAAQSKLPPCPSSRKTVWTDCEGTYTYDDWSKYFGAFKNDNRHGQGTMVYQDGQQYSGGFVNDRREGAGVYTSPNGNKWTGPFKNDKQNGRGVLTDKSGKVLKEGLWVDGVFLGETPAGGR